MRIDDFISLELYDYCSKIFVEWILPLLYGQILTERNGMLVFTVLAVLA